MTTKISQHVIESGAITSSHLTNITTAHVAEGSNLYHTTARARSAISVTGGFLSYDSGTGVLSHDGTPTFASINSTGNFTLDSAGVIYLDADGGNVVFQDAGTTIGTLSNQNQNFNIVSNVEDKDLIFKGNDGGTTITALTLDMSAGGDATFNSNLNTLGGITVGDSSADVLRFVGILKQGSGTGTTVIDASRNLTVNDAAVGGNLTVTGNLTVNGTQTILNTSTLTVDDKIITIADGASDAAAANESGINVDGASAQILYKSGNDRWEFNKEAFTAFGFMIGTTSTDVGLMRNSSGVFDFQAQSTRQISFSNATNGEHVRIDADGKVGIGTTSPNLKLHVEESAADAWIGEFKHTHADAYGLRVDLSGTTSSVRYALGVYTGGGTGFFVRNNGTVGIGTTSPGVELDIKRHTNGYPLRIGSSQGEGRTIVYADVHSSPSKYNWIAGTQYNVNNGYEITPSTAVGGYTFSNPAIVILNSGRVGIGETSPAHRLHISGATNDDARVRVHNSAGGQASLDLDNSEGYFRTFTDAGEYRIYDQTDGAFRARIDTSGNFAIGPDAPKDKFHIQTAVGDGQAFGGKSLSLTTSFQTGAQLAITLADHQGCYVKVFITGDWSSHSAMAFLGEYFIQNGAGGYSEPGLIIREIDNTSSVDSLSSQIVDSTNDTFQIQFKLNHTHNANTATGQLHYQIMGQFDTIA